MSSSEPALQFLLDSSVLVKLYYREEEDAKIALLLREGYLNGEWEIRVADISFYELANALHYSVKYSPEQIIERVQSLLAMELHTYGFDAWVLHSGLELCVEKNISIYDAYLVALAQRERLTFITADEKLWRKFHSDESIMALRHFRHKLSGAKSN